MTHLIVTNTDSGAGCLKQTRIADKVVCLGHQLVHGPAPFTPDPLGYFGARSALLSSDTEGWERDVDCVRPLKVWKSLASKAKAYDRIELWIDPEPNAQLQLVQLLDWIGTKSAVAEKLVLFHANEELGGCRPEDVASWKREVRPVSNREFAASALAWLAYRHESPELWHTLLNKNHLTVFPQFQNTVIRMLGELPSVGTGLTNTQTRLLELISTEEGRTSNSLFATVIGAERPAERPILRYWELGKVLDELAHCREPLVSGLAEGPFTLTLHDDKVRYDRYMRSALVLTDFGREVLEGRDDFARHNRVDRWWGGTRLTNDRLWRWNSNDSTLVPPS